MAGDGNRRHVRSRYPPVERTRRLSPLGHPERLRRRWPALGRHPGVSSHRRGGRPARPQPASVGARLLPGSAHAPSIAGDIISIV